MAKNNVWLSVSDLMTGLMIIFLFVAIAYMSQVKKNENVLVDYVETKTKLHDKLVNEFAQDTTKWQMAIGRDLSMKFTNPTVLFEQGKADIKPEFAAILDEFLPRYFDILLKDTLRNRIQEIRIEGHTDTVPFPSLDPDPYIANVILSQQRACNVVKYFRNMDCFKRYTAQEQRLLEYWFTANGLSYGHSLDHEGNLTINSGNGISNRLSRRVEFRIVTSGDEVLENFVKKKDNEQRTI